jgi:hypothetical protein
VSDEIQKNETIIELMLRKIRRHKDYAVVFGSPEGERVLMDILREGFVTSSTFVRGDHDETTMNEGSRRLALSILRFARTDHNERIRIIEQQMNQL